MIVFIALKLLLNLFFFAGNSKNIEYHFSFNDTLNVKRFGAKGDGIADDYPAYKKVVELVNERGRGIILFPKGTYYFAEYIDSTNPNINLALNNCNKVQVLGRKAVIEVNGSFNRSAGRKNPHYSEVNQVVPFYFSNCKNVSVTGIEINGNVDKMTRDQGVVEKGQGLISIFGCDNVKVSDVYVHHSASDGIYIGPTKKNSTHCILLNVKSTNNARQGLSITGLRGGYVKNCTFSNTGFTGKYGFHRPAAGVDIEPVQLLGGVKTGDISFENCTIQNNIGGQFLCTSPNFTSNINIQNCLITSVDSFSRYQIILAADSVSVQNSQMDLGKGNLWPTWKATPGSHVVVKNCTIKSSLEGVLSSSNDDRDSVWLLNNTLIFSGSSLSSYFPYLQTKNLYFEGNRVFIPAKTLSHKPYHSLIQNAISSKENKFYSDETGIKPKASYSKTKKVEDE